MRECHLARSYALQPVHPLTLGLGFQMVGQTHRAVKTAAKLRNRLQPRLGRDLEPIEDRLQALIDPDFIRDHDLRPIPPCHVQMHPFGSRSLGPVGRRTSQRHDGQRTNGGFVRPVPTKICRWLHFARYDGRIQ